MIELGQHAEYIIWAYVGVFAVTFGVIAWVVLASRSTKAKLAALEAQGIRRRSETNV